MLIAWHNRCWHLARVAARRVADYLRRVDPSPAAALEKTLGLLMDREMRAIYEHAGEYDTQAIERDVPELFQRFAIQRRQYAARSSEQEWQFAEQHARVLRQAVDRFRTGSRELRDRYMAENVRWILEHEAPGSKIVLWAHNNHVALVETRTWVPMGNHLKRTFGPEMVVFGFIANRGAVRVVDLRQGVDSSFTLGPAPERTIEGLLAAVGPAVFVVDLRKAPGPVADWLGIGRPTREVYGPFRSERSLLRKVAVGRRYDALIFIHSTSAARPVVSKTTR